MFLGKFVNASLITLCLASIYGKMIAVLLDNEERTHLLTGYSDCLVVVPKQVIFKIKISKNLN